jgi:hypothetical protein
MNTPPQPSDQTQEAQSLSPCTSVPDIDSPQRIWAEHGAAITIGAIVLIILVALYCIYLGYNEWQTGKGVLKKDLTNLNDVGSYLQGTSASLWALAGFFIIFVAFLIQTIQFTVQRKQFELQFAEQRKQFTLQANSVSRQSFEASFFQMLNLHNQIVLSMQIIEEDKIKASGRDCFKKWYDDFRQFSFGARFLLTEEGKAATVRRPENGIENYEAFYYEVRQAQLGHYFRNLYHLIKFVKEAEALKHPDTKTEYKTRRRYTSLVRATLSQFELALLFYNCASELGEEKFMPLVEEYGLLHNFNKDDLLATEKNKKIYDEKAFA